MTRLPDSNPESKAFLLPVQHANDANAKEAKAGSGPVPPAGVEPKGRIHTSHIVVPSRLLGLADRMSSIFPNWVNPLNHLNLRNMHIYSPVP